MIPTSQDYGAEQIKIIKELGIPTGTQMVPKEYVSYYYWYYYYPKILLCKKEILGPNSHSLK